MITCYQNIVKKISTNQQLYKYILSFLIKLKFFLFIEIFNNHFN